MTPALFALLAAVVQCTEGDCGRPPEYCPGFVEVELEGCGGGGPTLVDPRRLLVLAEPWVSREGLARDLSSLLNFVGADGELEIEETRVRDDSGRRWMQIRLPPQERDLEMLGPNLALCLDRLRTPVSEDAWSLGDGGCRLPGFVGGPSEGLYGLREEVLSRFRELVRRALPVVAAVPILPAARTSSAEGLETKRFGLNRSGGRGSGGGAGRRPGPSDIIPKSQLEEMGVVEAKDGWQRQASIAVLDEEILSSEECPLDQVLTKSQSGAKPVAGWPSNHGSKIACYAFKEFLLASAAADHVKLESVAIYGGRGPSCIDSATLAGIIAGLSAPVASLSLRLLGPACLWEPVKDAIAGQIETAFVFASGNCEARIEDCPAQQAAAGFELQNVATVGAYYGKKRRLHYVYGKGIDLAAPDGFTLIQGTSYTAPFVAAATAVLVAKHGLSPRAALSCILDNVEPGVRCDCSAGVCKEDGECLGSGGRLFVRNLVNEPTACLRR